jgi:hypothetical protein
MSTPDEYRAEFTAGLRELAAFIEAHPGLPVPLYAAVTYYPRGNDEEERAEVDRAAGILGREAAWTDVKRTHYEVARSFGPVAYRATSVTAAEMSRYRTHMAPYYGGAPTPEAGTDAGTGVA